jgi:hypothetical protein
MKDDRRPSPGKGDETIPPDVATKKQQPLPPREAVQREEDKYGESSLDENRGDQRDEHEGELDDIV